MPAAQDNPIEIGTGDRLFAALQHLLPKQLLSQLIYHVMRIEQPAIKRLLIRFFLRGYAVQMNEAAQPDPYAYLTFNAFFTRALSNEARLIDIDPAAVISPVDGTVSQCGSIDGDAIIQAKGHSYSLEELLGGAARSARYQGGTFACVYLAPHNYHRIHMPLTGSLRETLYIPGAFFSVNAATARAVPSLFARNERVVCDFDTEIGGMAVVLVGALFVGSIETVWAGEINPPARRGGKPVVVVEGRGAKLEKAAELGRFNMGSTVVLVFEPGKVEWSDRLTALARVRLGERIGTLKD